MRHLDGIAVSLRFSGRAVPEYDNQYCKKIHYLHRTIGSRGFTLKTGSKFEVRVKVDSKFQLHKASGISVVIGYHPDHYEEQGTDLAQVWWIPLESAGDRSEYVFNQTITWDKNHATRFIPYRIPAPAEHPEHANDDWLKSKVYMAGRGCISVHIQRGHVDLPIAARERSQSFYGDRTNVEPSMNSLVDYGNSAYPIRLDWFHFLPTKFSEPYVFEFRNLQAKEIDQSTAGIYEFSDETDIEEASDSEDGSVTNDDEIDISDSEPEEEVDEDEELEDEEENEDVVSRTNIMITDDGSPIKSTHKQRRSLRARNQIHQQLGQFEIFDNLYGENSRPGHDLDESTLRLQTPPSSNKQKPRVSKNLREPSSTLSNKAHLETSSAIKRKLADCDEDDEEIIPHFKPEKSQTPRTPAQESPNSPQGVGSGIGRPSSKRAKLIRGLELLRIEKEELRIEKEELELLKQLDELDE